MDNELLLFDRLEVIRKTIQQYGEDQFYLSFSGGKDSTVLSYLLDLAIPDNTIPRVFINTGIEYNKIVEFVKAKATQDKRVVMLQPTQNIKTILEKYGYPFKSKEYSNILAVYQRSGRKKSVTDYLGETGQRGRTFQCPDKLKYQFSEQFKLKVSKQCCYKLKKEPVKKWQVENNKPIVMTGMRKSEGGTRKQLTCIITDKANKLVKFHPLAVVSEEWEDWLIQKYNIQLCALYYEPYNFERTGCKGCPYALDLEQCLDTMSKYMPNERKQCELIWKPVYDEYRRVGYRLHKYEERSLF